MQLRLVEEFRRKQERIRKREWKNYTNKTTEFKSHHQSIQPTALDSLVDDMSKGEKSTILDRSASVLPEIKHRKSSHLPSEVSASKRFMSPQHHRGLARIDYDSISKHTKQSVNKLDGDPFHVESNKVYGCLH